MSYVAGFVTAVPAANKDAYRKQADSLVALFKELGVTRIVEAWGDDVPAGKVTDFHRAVKAKDDEVIVFSWHEYPDKAVAESANKKMMEDPRMEELAKDMPFDGRRMIFGGFQPIGEQKSGGKPGYIDGMLAPVSAGKRDVFREKTIKQQAAIMAAGAIRVVDAWGEYVPDGKVTDFKGAVKATGDEQVVFSWIEWPSKAVRDAAWKKLGADPAMQPDQMVFDGKRLVYGGFAPILDA